MAESSRRKPTARKGSARATDPARLDQPRERRLHLPRWNPEAFGRSSEAIARFMGTARFLVYMTVLIAAWLMWNVLAPEKLRFDPYTFTFLTLILSLQASYAAPLILLAQNRQADRDRLTMEEDRRRAAMQKADTEYLSREIASLRMALGEVATRDFLRSELGRFADDLADRLPATDGKAGKRKKARKADAGLDEPYDEYDEDDATDERRAPQGVRRPTSPGRVAARPD